MQLLKHFKELTVQPKNAKELKGLILQLAIQGKLTANWRKENPDVEPASELLNKISRNKEILIKSKKARNETAKKEFLKDKISFRIPKTWVSRNITEFYYTIGSRNNQIKSKDYNETGRYPIVSQGKNKIDGYSNDESKLLKINKPVVVFGDHTRLVKFIDFNFIIGADGTKILNPFDGIDSGYFYLHTSYYDLSNKGYARHYSLLKLEVFCLPPLEEQKEIVKVVATLFKEVEQLEQLTSERIALKEDFVNSVLNQLTTHNAKENWNYLQEHFKPFFNEKSNIKKLRETLLQLAVQGKLSADWRTCYPEFAEGSHHASVLLKRIQEEKAKLIKEKKIKKEKVLPKITREEIPYDLPDGWVWCYFKQITVFQNGYAFKSSKFSEKGIRLVRNTNIAHGEIDWNDEALYPMKELEGLERFKLEKDDILLSLDRPIIKTGLKIATVKVEDLPSMLL
jgi:type I restriction enzyme S subunit